MPSRYVVFPKRGHPEQALPEDQGSHDDAEVQFSEANTVPALFSVNVLRLTLRTAVPVQIRRALLTLRRAELTSAHEAPVYPGTEEKQS